jgi:hypothetical protein
MSVLGGDLKLLLENTVAYHISKGRGASNSAKRRDAPTAMLQLTVSPSASGEMCFARDNGLLDGLFFLDRVVLEHARIDPSPWNVCRGTLVLIGCKRGF